jgi:hypothetical protein
MNRPGSLPPNESALEKLRILLKRDPSVVDLVTPNYYRDSPYEMAERSRKVPDAILRLMLRAYPSTKPAKLRELNYAERRMAMFLAFSAVVSDSSGSSSSSSDDQGDQQRAFVNGLRRLTTDVDMPLLRHVVSYL